MVNFQLEGSDEYYLYLSDQPKRFDADSPATNVFFDDTNGQVFTVRSGGVTGVTVTGLDENKNLSFLMEDRGPIISIKFSPDQSILAIQRNKDNQNATVEFVNFKNSEPTNVEYSHTCKWKNGKILGFVWPKANEIAFITDHGIELLQVLPEKKQLKTLKSTSFSGAWFQWCGRSKLVLLASNNGVLLQPFSLNNSTITKLQKLELDSSRPVVERDVVVLRVCSTSWCAVFRHGTPTVPGSTEVWLMPISGPNGQYTHILRTGLSGRFAVSIVDDLVVVHHQSSQTSQLFDLLEQCKTEGSTVAHVPVVPSYSMRPAIVNEQYCPMYSATWVMFQPDYVIDARLGCLWKVRLIPSGLAHNIPPDEIAGVVAVLLRRRDCRDTIYRVLTQLVRQAKTYLMQLSAVFDEINTVYRKWCDLEVARNTAGPPPPASSAPLTVITQEDMCARVLQPNEDTPYILQVVTAYLGSASRKGVSGAGWGAGEALLRAGVVRGRGARGAALARRGALAPALPLACALLSLPGHHQLALDMLARLNAHQEIIEVLLSSDSAVTAIGAARQAGGEVWPRLQPRKLLAAARRAGPSDLVAVTHALIDRNDRYRGSPHFLKSEQCDIYLEYYKQVTEQ